jgi:hypothetical protein
MRFYPKDFATTFGESVEQAFRDLARDAYRERGRFGLALLWFRIVPDFLFSAFELFTATAADYLKWSFRLRWIAACSVGFATGLYLSNSLLIFGPIPIPLRAIPLWIVLGLLQSFAITRKYCNRTRWVLFSAVGAVLAAAITRAIMPDPRTLLAILPVWAITLLDVPAVIHGAVIGMFQWKSFRKDLPKTSRWIIACSAGLYAFWVLAVQTWAPATFIARQVPDLIGMELNFNFFEAANFVNFLITGAIFGAITVVPLERILRLQPSSTEPLAQTLARE